MEQEFQCRAWHGVQCRLRRGHDCHHAFLHVRWQQRRWVFNPNQPVAKAAILPCGHHNRGVDCPQHGVCPADKKRVEVPKPAPEPVEVPKLPENAEVVVRSLTLDMLNKMAELANGEGVDVEQFEHLGAGVHRTVYAIRGTPLVVKVGRSPEANKKEEQAWKSLKPEQKGLFAPVLWCSTDGKLLVSVRAVKVGKMGDPRWAKGGFPEKDPFKVNAMLKTLGLTVEDLHSQNLGELDGHPVIIDYGFGVQ